jgi:hypothetical protein
LQVIFTLFSLDNPQFYCILHITTFEVLGDIQLIIISTMCLTCKIKKQLFSIEMIWKLVIEHITLVSVY